MSTSHALLDRWDKPIPTDTQGRPIRDWDGDPIEYTDTPLALSALDEGEMCLAAILMDESGLDLAEMTWVDGTQVHGCWRAYPYQWMWWRDMSPRAIDQGARSVGKSESIIAEACAFVFNYPREEFVIVTPESSHADALTERMETRMTGSRLMREMLARGRSGINHKPFKAMFQNGARIMSRLPQRSGVGVKGIHPIVLHCDEAQDISEATYDELPETVRWEVKGARWRCHGVSRGVQDDAFYRMTKEGSGWKIHHIGKLHRPDLEPYSFRRRADGEWIIPKRYPFREGQVPNGVDEGTKPTMDPKAPYTNVTELAHQWAKDQGGVEVIANWRERTALGYEGGLDSQDFRRNVYGVHGTSMNRIFVLDDLMAVTDDNDGSYYNEHEYRQVTIRGENVAARARARTGTDAHKELVYDEIQAQVLTELFPIPADHIEKYKTFWMGMDVGIINDPTEIMIFAEYVPDAKERRADDMMLIATPPAGVTRFKLLARIRMQRIAAPLQARFIMHLINGYKPRAFSMDGTGNGVAVLQDLQMMAGTERVYIMEGTEDLSLDEDQRELAAAAQTVIKPYNFGAKVVVGIDNEKVTKWGLEDPKDILEQAAIRQNVKDKATDVLRDLVAHRRMMLPHDGEIRNQLNSQQWTSKGEPVDAYGNRARIYSQAVDHILDAARMFALGWFLQPIEEIEESIRKPAASTFPIFG